MYGARELSIANIRKELNSYDLFSYYCAPFKEININFCSELRKDKAPTCCIQAYQSTLFYKDFGTGDSFDDIGYIQAKYSIDFRGALSMVNRDFKLGLSGGIDVNAQPTMQFFGIPDKKVNIEDYIRESADIRVQIRKWQQSDADYWREKYKFTSADLGKYGVFPLKYFWMNGRGFNCKNNTYGYYLGKEDGKEKWKIYQPLDLRERKWFSNISKKNIQGDKQLPEKGDKLYITSSLKDVITLNKIGLHAVAPSAEATVIEEEQINKYKQRFNELIIFYDNDDPGIKASNKHAKLYDAKQIWIPPHYNVKDPSDLVDEYDYNELITVVNDPSNLS